MHDFPSKVLQEISWALREIEKSVVTFRLPRCKNAMGFTSVLKPVKFFFVL